MSNFVFEIEYMDRFSGDTVIVEVSGMKMAQQLARSLAMANGRRAMIRRKQDGDTWSIILVTPGSDACPRVIQSRLSKREACRMWRQWNHRREKTVVLPWPDSARIPRRFGL